MNCRLVLLLSLVGWISAYTRVCYFTNWAQYRKGVAKFTPSNIDPFLCTHIVYAFAVLKEGLLSTYEWNDETRYGEVMDLRNKNHDLKVLLAVGGWNHESKAISPFSMMVGTPLSRKIFIDHAVTFLRKYGFDGLDLDWEYPTQRDNSGPGDRGLFTLLCKELLEAFELEATSGKSRLSLTAAVAAGESTINAAYDVGLLGRYLDSLHLMTYDLHGSWEAKTGHHTSMTEQLNEWSVISGLDLWISKGFPAGKIALGLATYGRTFTLSDKDAFQLGAPASGAGIEGMYTGEKGFYAYYEVCMLLDKGMAVTNVTANAPYGHIGNFWIGYDDKNSLIYKVKKLIKGRGLMGAMFWAIDLDDFTGNFCNGRPYPLMNAVKEELNEITIPTSPDKSITKSYTRVCYFTNWAQYREIDAKFTPQNIDPFLCTHIVYAFAVLKEGLLSTYEWNDEVLYAQMMDLRKKNHNLKVLLAVGGWKHESGKISPFSVMVRGQMSRNIFIDKAVKFLRKYNFDGLDLDWEYPTQRNNSGPEDRGLFTLLCKELRNAFKLEATLSGKNRLLLTAAVAAGENTINAAYDADKLGNYLDSLHLMTYDLHGSWETKTGHHTSMTEQLNKWSVISGLDLWIKKGFPSAKIALGLATYGRTFTLVDSNDFKLGAQVSGAGMKGKYTKEKGFYAYYEICLLIAKGMSVSNATVNAPYGHLGNFWIGYDDVNSLRYKVNKLIKGRGLMGAMFWALDLDDFKGTFCKAGPYPLINAVRKELSETTISPTLKASVEPSIKTSIPSSVKPDKKLITKLPIKSSKSPRIKSSAKPKILTTLSAIKSSKSPRIKSSAKPKILTTISPIELGCRPTRLYKTTPGMVKWCIDNCAGGYCPTTHCICGSEKEVFPNCRPVGLYVDTPGMTNWCIANCMAKYCPETHCKCDKNDLIIEDFEDFEDFEF